MKIYENERVCLVITGIPGVHALSANRKTGPMAQAWVLPKRDSPTHPSGQSVACGNCPLSPANKGGCYVITGQAPLAVWRRYVLDDPLENLDQIPRMPLGVRITAWGDPTKLPADVWQKVLEKAPLYTGYTHQWRDLDPLEWGWLMASVESASEAEAARDLGWRTFRILGGNEEPDRACEVMCPALAGEVQCYTCGLCCGNRLNKRSITVKAHGAMRKKALEVVAAAGGA